VGLADLLLDNLNIFYELAIRHVMREPTSFVGLSKTPDDLVSH
jgi:hypothetical protein